MGGTEGTDLTGEEADAEQGWVRVAQWEQLLAQLFVCQARQVMGWVQRPANKTVWVQAAS